MSGVVGMRGTESERFWAKVDTAGPWAMQHHAPGQCWVWTKSDNGLGYGQFYLAGGKKVKAHRWAYESIVRTIPAGLDLDHVCRRHSCVNPAHLEPVTRSVNLLRGDTFSRAHHEARDCGYEGCRSCVRFHRAAIPAT